MSYILSLKVKSASGVPEGDWNVVLYKNKLEKKDKNESKTEIVKKSTNPVWNFSVEFPASPTDEIIFELQKSKKSYATGNLTVGLIDNKEDNTIRLKFQSSKSQPTGNLTLVVWASFSKNGASSSNSSPSSATVADDSVVRRPSLRTAQKGSGKTITVAHPPASVDSVEDDQTTAKEATKKSSKHSKHSKKSHKHEDTHQDDQSDDSDQSDPEVELELPPRKKAKPKRKVVPDDEDPEDFWNGVSKSKTKEKRKEIKKLQQSLESMTINLKSSWKPGSADNQQQRFSTLISDLSSINQRPDACAGYRKIQDQLQVRLAFAVDLPVDKASGCGIDPSKWIYVEFTFNDGNYISKDEKSIPKAPNKTLLVRQCPPMSSLEEISAFTEPSQFGFWWTLEQHLTQKLVLSWKKFVEEADQRTKSVEKKGGVDSESLTNAWAMLEILEWPSSKLGVVIKALKESKNDVKQALDLVLEESWLKEALSTAEPVDAVAPVSKNTKNFLTCMIDTITEMIVDSGKYCPICGEPHPLELFKPIVCGNELCKFQFSNMGLGVDFESELLHAPQSVDLLIALTSHATSGTHFDPFPHEVSAKIDGVQHQLKTPSDVAMCLMKCPSVEEMQQMAKAGTLRAQLTALHPLLYLLLRWIITSSRAHLHFLDSEEDKIPQIDTPYQFHLKSTPPEKEQKFYAAKKKYGSFYAWHGSATSNWHSILRNGLKNYSKTKHQVNGAAYGPGVYMAVDSATSIGYSWRSSNDTWQKSQFKGELIILALCEVINEGELLCTGNVHRPRCLHSPSAPYYRIEKDDYITTRYLFVVNSRDINVQAASIQSYIKSKQLLRSNKAAKHGKKQQMIENQ